MQSILERVELYQESPSLAGEPTKSVRVQAPSPALSGAVFIVHGHGHRESEVARVVEQLGLEPVILKEVLHGGAVTLIEKLEREGARCGYAVVVITADDEGRGANSSEELKPRARQNVVLELGYFIARLGRERVTILHDPAVDVPSDFAGVAYYPLDEHGAWIPRLVGELERALS